MPLSPAPPPGTMKPVSQGRGFTIRLTGLDKAFVTLRKRGERLATVREPLEYIAKDFFEEQRGWLSSEGMGSWKPLNPEYAKRKLKKYGALPILQRTRKLFQSFTGTNRPYTIDGARLTVNVKDAPYWRVHEKGSVRRHIPQRVVISPKLRQRIKQWHQYVTDWLAGHDIHRGRARRS